MVAMSSFAETAMAAAIRSDVAYPYPYKCIGLAQQWSLTVPMCRSSKRVNGTLKPTIPSIETTSERALRTRTGGIGLVWAPRVC